MSPRPQRTTACAAAELSTPPVYRRLCEDFSARSEQLVQVREDTQTLLCESSSQAFIKAAGACEAKLDQQLQATREPWPAIPAAGLGDWKLNTNAARDASGPWTAPAPWPTQRLIYRIYRSRESRNSVRLPPPFLDLLSRLPVPVRA